MFLPCFNHVVTANSWCQAWAVTGSSQSASHHHWGGTSHHGSQLTGEAVAAGRIWTGVASIDEGPPAVQDVAKMLPKTLVLVGSTGYAEVEEVTAAVMDFKTSWDSDLIWWQKDNGEDFGLISSIIRENIYLCLPMLLDSFLLPCNDRTIPQLTQKVLPSLTVGGLVGWMIFILYYFITLG